MTVSITIGSKTWRCGWAFSQLWLFRVSVVWVRRGRYAAVNDYNFGVAIETEHAHSYSGPGEPLQKWLLVEMPFKQMQFGKWWVCSA